MSDFNALPQQEEEESLLESIVYAPGRAVAGAVRGVAGAAAGVANLFGADIQDNFGLGKSEDMVGGFAEGISQFLTGFIPVAGWLGRGAAVAGTSVKLAGGLAKAAKGGSVLARGTQAAAAGAVADFAVFDGNDPRLSNLIQDMPSLQNPLTEFLAADENDGELFGRMKNVIEGAGLGLMADGLLAMFRTMKRYNRNVAQGDLKAAAKDQEELAAMAEENMMLDRNELETEMRSMADPSVEPQPKWEEEGLVEPEVQEPAPKPKELDISKRQVEKRLEVDPRAGDVVVIDVNDNTSEFMRGTAGFERLKRAPNSRMSLIQLKPRGEIRVASVNRLKREDGLTAKKKDETPEVYRDRAEKLAKEKGYDAFEFNDGNHRAVSILNEEAAVHRRTNVDSAENFFSVKRKGEKLKDEELLISTPIEKIGHEMGLDKVRVKALAQKIEEVRNTKPEDIEGLEVIKEIKGIINLDQQGGRGYAALHQLLLEEELNLGRYTSEVVTHEQLIESVAKGGLDKMLGGRDPKILAKELEISAGNVRAASHQAKTAELLMHSHLDDMKELSSQAGKEARRLEEGGGIVDGSPEALELDRILEKIGRLTETYAMVASMYGRVRSEFGRGLNSFGLPVDKVLDNDLIQAMKSRGGRKRALAMAKRIKFDADVGLEHLGGQLAKRDKKSRLWNAFTDWWMFSLLSAPRTLTTNVIGSSLAMMYRPVEQSVGGWVARKLLSPEAAAEFRKVQRTHMRQVNNQAMLIKNMAKFKTAMERSPESTQTLEAMKKAFKNNKGVLSADSSAAFMDFVKKNGEGMSPENLQQILGKEWDKDSGMYSALNTIAKIVKMPSRMMVASDEMIKQISYQSHVMAELQERAYQHGMAPEVAEQWVHSKMQRMSIEGTALTQKNARTIAEDRLRGEVFSDEVSRQQHIEQEFRKIMRDEPEDGMVGPQLPNLGDLSPLAEKAKAFAEEVTFTKPLDPSRGPLAKLGTLLMDFAQAHPFMVMFTPFIKTPMNILMFTADRLPIPGLNKDFVPMVRHMMSKIPGLPAGLRDHNSKFTKALMGPPEEAAEALGRATTTLGAMSVFGTLAASGVITGGGPKDIDQLKVLKASGWQPYSIKVGDTYMSYQRLDPLAGLLAYFGDVADISRWSTDAEGMEQLMYAGFAATLKNVESKSYLSGVISLVDLVSDPESNAEKMAGRLTGNLLVPNAIAAMRGFTDDSMAEARGVLDAVQRRVPFMSDNAMEPQRNVMGEPVNKKQLAAGIKGAEGFAGYFLPLAFNRTTSDLVTKELADLAYSFSPPGPKRLGVDLRDFQNPNGQSAYDRWQELTGKVKVKGRLLKPALERLIRSRDYQGLPKESLDQMDITSPRVVMLQSLVSRYRGAAQKQLMKEYPELQRQTQLRVDVRNKLRQGAAQSDIQTLLDRGN